MVADTLESLRPKLTIYTNLEEAVQNLEKLNKEHQEQIEKATPAEQVNDSSQPLPIPNTPHSNVGTRSPAASLGTSPCESPMLREEDELSGTWESEGEDEDAGPDPHGMESDINLTEVDMSDMDMNKVKVLSPPKLEPTVEDKEFLAAFDKVMLDDIQSRREENLKVTRLSIPKEPT
ncbi:PREDICTED: regulator of nonsense transcripts 2-like [Acropora digitifera]|uniref:regulator of nonsense transcripts 2-like n=1 Tax=Acropora digitifera TaxID=70779 RepID=UPI000779F201|nr:PREDICTED: regulator of nonsense transcripts 2-like [Acropora digitifera]